MLIRVYDTNNETCLFETPFLKADWSRGLSKTGPWSMSLPLTEETYDLLTEGMYLRLYIDGQYQIGGIIKEKNVNYDTDPVVEIAGSEELDVIYNVGPNQILYPNNESYILELFNLLNNIGWRFGQYRDIDRTRLVTLDLRKERNALTQLQSLSKFDPNLYYRFGGYDGETPLLDFGDFDDLPRHTVFSASAGEQANKVVISSVKSRDVYGEQIYAARGVGGRFKYSAGTADDAHDTYLESDSAIDLNPALAFDPDYPIYEEVVSNVYTIIPTSVGAIGGSTYSPTAINSDVAIIGDLSGTATNNSWAQFTFKVIPGRLQEVSWWTGNVVGEANLKLLTLAWEVCEVVEANPWIPGTLLATGTIPATSWTANSRCRVTFDNYTILSTYDKRLMFRCGFTTQPAASNVIRINAYTPSNNARTIRLDRATARSSGYLNNNYWPQFEAISEGLVQPLGKEALLENSKFIPPRPATRDYSIASEVREASLALYEWTVEQIKLSYLPHRTVDIILEGYDLSWRPGDKVRLVKQLQFPNGNRQETEDRIIESVGWSAADQQIKMTVKWLNRADPEPENQTLAEYEWDKKKFDIRYGLYQPNAKPWTLTELTAPISFRTPDTKLSDGTPAITITFSVPATPTAKFETRIIGTPYADYGDKIVDVEVISSPPDALVVRAAIHKVGWTVYDTATFYAHIVWR